MLLNELPCARASTFGRQERERFSPLAACHSSAQRVVASGVGNTPEKVTRQQQYLTPAAPPFPIRDIFHASHSQPERDGTPSELWGGGVVRLVARRPSDDNHLRWLLMSSGEKRLPSFFTLP